jgi:3-oxoacyl-[acyl-carrier protein] reductase
MADFLVDMGPTSRNLVKRLGLPLPLPQKLKRAKGGWTERELEGHQIAFTGPGGDLSDAIANTLAASGADVFVEGDSAPFKGPGEAFGHPVRSLLGQDDLRTHSIVVDASGLATPQDLRVLFDFLSPRIRGLRSSGRLVVLGRPHHGMKDVAAAAAQRALEGFVRSAGRELGRKGATAQLMVVEAGAEDRVPATLRWILSARSAYISGQPIRLSKRVKAPSEAPSTRSLEGKVALVTGAARGIGAATAIALHREGAHVICLDRPADDAPASALNAAVDGTLLLCDVTDPEAPSKIAKLVREKFSGIDIIVHNAGITRDRTLAKMKDTWWDQTIDVNLSAVLEITTALKPLLNSHARIICLSSIAGISGNVGQTNYSTSKAGIIGFVEALAPQLAKRGIAVNAVAPGFIETRLTAAIPVATREVARRLCNLSQGGLPEDIAETITFLASPGACGLSGQVVRVCGGSFVGA